MKTSATLKIALSLIAIAGIFSVISPASVAQDIKIASYVEKTAASPKMGTSAGYRFGCSFEVGGFYQREIRAGFSESTSKSEHEFYGMYFRIPVICREKVALDFQVRSGTVNRENFTITPSIHVAYRPVRFLGISAGMGVRNLRPTFMPAIEILL